MGAHLTFAQDIGIVFDGIYLCAFASLREVHPSRVAMPAERERMACSRPWRPPPARAGDWTSVGRDRDPRDGFVALGILTTNGTDPHECERLLRGFPVRSRFVTIRAIRGKESPDFRAIRKIPLVPPGRIGRVGSFGTGGDPLRHPRTEQGMGCNPAERVNPHRFAEPDPHRSQVTCRGRLHPHRRSPKNLQMTEIQEPKGGRKVAAAILGTLVLGAIGSGIWDRVGGPLFDVITRLLIGGIDLITRTYKDSIYREAAYGFQEASSSFIHQQFLGILPVFYFFLILRHPWLKEKMPRSGDSRFKTLIRSSKGFYLISVVTVIVFVTCFVSVMRLTYVRGVITYAQTTIQRLAPHIDEQEEEELLAQLRSVRESEDYYAFYERLQQRLKNFQLKDYGRKPL